MVLLLLFIRKKYVFRYISHKKSAYMLKKPNVLSTPKQPEYKKSVNILILYPKLFWTVNT